MKTNLATYLRTPYLNSARYYYRKHYIPCILGGYDALAIIYEHTVWKNLFLAAEHGEI